MSLEARCVFDTGAILSALLFEHSVPGQALHLTCQPDFA
jgi:hypothetical protein